MPEPVTTKGLLGSKTIWGVLVMLFGPFLMDSFGVDLQVEAERAIEAVGAFLAVYGRTKASGKIDDIF